MAYFFSLFLGTFLLEDVALSTAIFLYNDNQISLANGIFACFIGISIGDLALYGLGSIAKRFATIRNLRLVKSAQSSLKDNKTTSSWDYWIVLSRAIPGTRLPTYIGAGLIEYSFLRFITLTIVSVAAWVGIIFYLGIHLKSTVAKSPVLFFLSLFIILFIVKKIIFFSSDIWARRAFLPSLKKWLYFEFWPAWLFYLPIVPIYIFHAIRTLSFLNPFYANPKILNGGLVGESKWDFLKYLKPVEASTLRSVFLQRQSNTSDIIEQLQRHLLTYPFFLKPDVGQRGFAVRLIKDEAQLTEYLKTADFDLVAQQKSRYTKEAGVFYIKSPQTQKSFLFSITLKEFPSIIGDGRTPIGNLILNDSRAQLIASTYFSRHKDHLHELLSVGERLPLTECGNHCQGAIFKNGNHLMTPELLRAMDTLAQNIPHFYFGRLDIRYNTDDELKAGKNFEIIEINGAGSEATHIWDRSTTLWDAYKTLNRQWSYLFDIGKQAKTLLPIEHNVSLFSLFKDLAKLNRGKHQLTVSS